MLCRMKIATRSCFALAFHAQSVLPLNLSFDAKVLENRDRTRRQRWERVDSNPPKIRKHSKTNTYVDVLGPGEDSKSVGLNFGLH